MVPGQHLGPSTLPCRRSLTISSRSQFLAFSWPFPSEVEGPRKQSKVISALPPLPKTAPSLSGKGCPFLQLEIAIFGLSETFQLGSRPTSLLASVYGGQTMVEGLPPLAARGWGWHWKRSRKKSFLWRSAWLRACLRHRGVVLIQTTS